MADRTRLELATSGVTGRHSNQLNYRSAAFHVFQHESRIFYTFIYTKKERKFGG